MKHYPVQQGSADWHQLKLGVPSASEFEKIISPGKLEYSSQARKYAFRLAAERLLNRPLTDDVQTKWMERGTQLEIDAVKLFQFQEEIRTELCGFCTTDDGKIGASPDRFIGADGLLEVKCPAPHTHLGYMVDGFGPEYRIQCQGQLLVCEREWNTRLSHHPEMPQVADKRYRDEVVISKIRDALDRFLDELHEITEKAKALGVIQAADFVLTPEEIADEQRGPSAPFYHTIINPFDDPTPTLMAG